MDQTYTARLKFDSVATWESLYAIPGNDFRVEFYHLYKRGLIKDGQRTIWLQFDGNLFCSASHRGTESKRCKEFDWRFKIGF